jgi:hypothetical protein
MRFESRKPGLESGNFTEIPAPALIDGIEREASP